MAKKKLSKKAVLEILANAGRGGKTYKELAEKYGVGIMTINLYANDDLKKRSLEAKKKWRDKNKEWYRNYARTYNQELKKRVLGHYKRTEQIQCECCGEKEINFLSIDHMNGGGREHMRTIKSSLYSWLEKNNFPDIGLRVLCMNCNHAFGHYKKCFH